MICFEVIVVTIDEAFLLNERRFGQVSLMVMINDWIFHRKTIGQGDRLLHKFPPPDGVAEIYVVAHAPV